MDTIMRISSTDDVDRLQQCAPWRERNGVLRLQLISLSRFTLARLVAFLFCAEQPERTQTSICSVCRQLLDLDLDLRDTSHGFTYSGHDLFGSSRTTRVTVL